MTRRVLLAGAAGFGLGAAPARAPAPASGPPLTFGALFPFTGDAALLGDEAFRGLALAVEALNSAGGLDRRKVVLKQSDARNPSLAASAAKALIEREKVSAIFGTGTTAMALTASAASALANVPYFELTATGSAVTGRGLPSVFRSCSEVHALGALSVAGIADVLAPLWQRELRSLRVAVLAVREELGLAISEAQAAACKSRGLAIAQTLTYPPGTGDFMPLIRALKGARIEVVLHSGLSNDIVLFYRGMAEAAWQPRMVIGSGPSYAMADTRAAVGPGLDGTLIADFPPYAINPHAAPGVTAVGIAYQTKYGAAPRSGLSLAAYVGAGFFFAAIAKAGGTDLVKLRTALLTNNVACEKTANGWGAEFDVSGQNRRACPVLAQWQNGGAAAVFPRKFAAAMVAPDLRPLPVRAKRVPKKGS
ncbi:MAG: ABC transporter substrate-binding protein [Acetobacteraceae bacterium]